MKMKKIIIAAAIAALAICGCAKVKSTGLNDQNKLYFDSWIHINYPNLTPTTLGSYIIEMQDGDASNPVICDSSYMLMNYTITSLDGTGVSTNDTIIAKQWGTFSSTDYNGPIVSNRADNGLYAGLEELLQGKHVGVHVKAVIPGWLLTQNRYDTAEEYLANESGDNSIYDIRIVGSFDNTKRWELDSMFNYLHHNYPKVSLADTLNYRTSPEDSSNFEGFYFIETQASDRPDSVYSSDAKIYINYIGRLLNGNVFDTNIADTAKVYGLYDSSRSYEPSLITWGDSYSDLTMGSSGSDMITGFKLGLYQMHPHQKASLIFYSLYGYSYSGTSTTIPAYAQLRFDIEVTENE